MRIFQEGNRAAKIIIVGDAPSRQDDLAGRPFTGGAGDLLDRMLSKVGISRRDVFLTTVCHIRPPEDDFKWFYKPTNIQHLALGAALLKRNIDTIRPNLVIALGPESLKVLTGQDGISKWRGSTIPCKLVPGVKVLGTFHPSYILRQYDYKAVAEFDLHKAAKEQLHPGFDYPERRIYLPDGVWTRQRGAIEWSWRDEPHDMGTLAERLLTGAKYLATDIECYNTPKGWQLACVGFAPNPNEALVIPADTGSRRALIKHYCESDTPKVLQNGTFDTIVLGDEGVELKNFDWDTMIAHHILYAECAGGGDEMAALAGKKQQAAIAKGLAFLASVNTNEPFYKDDGKLWRQDGDRRVFYRYNGSDCCVTAEVRDVQYSDLESEGVFSAFRDTMELVDPLVRSTRRGLKVNTAVRDRFRHKIESEIERLQGFLDLQAGTPVNVKSSKQVGELLFDKLKFPAKLKPNGGRTADKDAIIELAGKYEHPVLLTILKIRQRRDLIERYINTPIDSDGRMRCSFDITGTRSYRLSSRASIYGSGTNLQNQPESLREMYVADPGKVFVYRDFSQAEARVVAYLARDQWLIDLFNDPTKDIHKETAAAIFNVPVGQVTPPQRQLGKKSRHALNYGMNANRFVEVVNQDSENSGVRIDLATAKRVIDGFFMLHPNHKSVYWKRVEEELRYSRTLRNPFGYKRTFYARWDHKLLLDAYSWIPQSTVGIMGRKAWVNIDRAVRHLGAEVLVNVHDSILVQCDDDPEVVCAVAKRMEDCMTIPVSIDEFEFIIPTDCKVGYNWGNRSKDGLTNPNGLRDIDKWLTDPRIIPEGD